MKVVAINGSPRKKWNTAMLLEKALEGAVSHWRGVRQTTADQATNSSTR